MLVDSFIFLCCFFEWIRLGKLKLKTNTQTIQVRFVQQKGKERHPVKSLSLFVSFLSIPISFSFGDIQIVQPVKGHFREVSPDDRTMNFSHLSRNFAIAQIPSTSR